MRLYNTPIRTKDDLLIITYPKVLSDSPYGMNSARRLKPGFFALVKRWCYSDRNDYYPYNSVPEGQDSIVWEWGDTNWGEPFEFKLFSWLADAKKAHAAFVKAATTKGSYAFPEELLNDLEQFINKLKPEFVFQGRSGTIFSDSKFESDLEQGKILFTTRAHGDTGYATAGQKDIENAKAFVKDIRERYGKKITAHPEIVDEWVNVTLSYNPFHDLKYIPIKRWNDMS